MAECTKQFVSEVYKQGNQGCPCWQTLCLCKQLISTLSMKNLISKLHASVKQGIFFQTVPDIIFHCICFLILNLNESIDSSLTAQRIPGEVLLPHLLLLLKSIN